MEGYYNQYRYYIYINNCKYQNTEPNKYLVEYFRGGVINLQSLNAFDKEVLRLINEYTLYGRGGGLIDFNVIISNINTNLKKNLIHVDNNSKIRKNRKKSEIFSFIFSDFIGIEYEILSHIVVLIFRTLQDKYFNTKIDNSEPLVGNTEVMLQKNINKVVQGLELFLNFHTNHTNGSRCYDNKKLFAVVFYILNIMVSTEYKGVFLIKIKTEKSLHKGAVRVINKLYSNIEVGFSIVEEINVFNYPIRSVSVWGEWYMCPVLFLYAVKVVKQKYTKKQSNFTDDLVKTLLTLSNTKVFICCSMLEKIKKFVDNEHVLLKIKENILIDEFNKKIKSYNEYKRDNRIETSELWLSNSLDILLEGYKKITCNDNIRKNNLKFLETTHNELLLSTSQNLFLNTKRLKTVISSEQKKKIELLNKQKFYLQLEISKLQRHLSKIALINFWYKYYEYIRGVGLDGIYFIAYCDFRGRIYYKSPVSLQSSWMFRFIYHLGSIDINEYRKINIQLPSFYETKMYSSMVELGIYDIKLFYSILSLGILFKSRVVSNKGFRSMVDIFYNGLSIYKLYKLNSLGEVFSNLEDLAHTTYIINIIDQVNCGNIKRWYILKDTTASVNQHLGKIFGFKDGALKYVNLDNTAYMFDTYELYVDFLRDYFKIECPTIVPFLDRKILKKIIMTVPYGIGSSSAFKYFCDLVDKHITDTVAKRELLIEFNKIYKILSDQVVESKYLYKKDKNDFKKKITTLESFVVEDFELFIKYYEPKSNIIEFTFNKKRKSITIDVVDFLKLDAKKTEISALVNLIHMLDASFLRRLVRKLNGLDVSIITIHDGFLVSFFEIDFLMICANEVFLVTEDCGVFEGINKGVIIGSTSILI